MATTQADPLKPEGGLLSQTLQPTAMTAPTAPKADEVVQGMVDPGRDTVQGQMTGLLSGGSDYIKLAREQAKEFSNKRGLLNSSIAANAGQRAAIESALPIAQQDASTYFTQNLSNQGNQSEANTQARQQQYGLETIGAQTGSQIEVANEAARLQAERDTQLHQQGLAEEEVKHGYQVELANMDVDSRNTVQAMDTSGRVMQQMLQGLVEIDAMDLDAADKNVMKANLQSATVASLQAIAAVSEIDLGPLMDELDAALADLAQEQGQAPSATGGTTGGTTTQDPVFTCFPGETLVWMADGSKKRIDEVLIGDEVMGGYGHINKVEALDRPLLGKRDLCQINGDLKTTIEHPLWTSQGWGVLSIDAYIHEEYGKPVDCILVTNGGQRGTLTYNGIPPEQMTEVKAGHKMGFRDGYKEIERIDVITDLSPVTPLYSLVLTGSHTMMLGDGYIVSGWARPDFDYSTFGKVSDDEQSAAA